MPSLDATIDLLHLLGDPTRVRLLALLGQAELSVGELTAITGLPQPRVSTHLGKLREAGMLRDRRVGASTFYALAEGAMPDEAAKIWGVLSEQTRDALLEGDRERCQAALRAREAAPGWPDALAGQMERHYSPGRTWEAMARGLIGLLSLGEVLDVGSGDGTIAQLLLPRARAVTCVDRSDKMIAAAQARLGPGARCVVGDAHQLPFDDERFDQVLLFNVLTCAERPAKVLAEASRVLRRGGSVALVTLAAHDHPEITAAYGHLHPGFSPAALSKLIARAHLEVASCEVSSRERRPPYFEIVTATAHKP